MLAAERSALTASSVDDRPWPRGQLASRQLALLGCARHPLRPGTLAQAAEPVGLRSLLILELILAHAYSPPTAANGATLWTLGAASSPAAFQSMQNADESGRYNLIPGSAGASWLQDIHRCLPFKVLVYFLFGERTHNKSC